MATLLEQDETPPRSSLSEEKPATVVIDGVEYPQILLSRGLYTTVDWSNYWWLIQWKWCALVSRKTGRSYAVRLIYEKGRVRTVFMHREILGLKRFDRSVVGDHRDNSRPLDNRMSNLRSCTKQENECNVGPRSNNTSGYKGVTHYKARNQWFSYITVKGRRYSLGYYPIEEKESAARAYDAAAIKYFGEFAYLNFPDERK